MANDWQELPLDSELFKNLNESVLRKSPIILENMFINEAKGQTRFPGLRRLDLMSQSAAVTPRLPGGGPVYLDDWRGNLIAATGNGRVFRLQADMTYEDVTEAVIAGTGRIVFGETPNQKLMAAGKQIVQLRKDKTEILSLTAPLSTHATYLSGYALASEADSQRFFNSPVGDFTNWDQQDFFSAESKPDNVTALITTERGELIIAGTKSVEQWEPYPGGTKAFFRRWQLGQGIIAPYTLTEGDGEIWAMNSKQEFVSFAGQNNRPRSLTISLELEKISDWEGAWASPPMHLFGQKFIIIKIPNAVNEYGSKGLTLLHDYKARRWAFLYGWDEENSVPGPWPGNSYHYFQSQHFVGGLNGEIYVLDDKYYQNDGVRQQARWRSAGLDSLGDIRINGLRMRFSRGDPVTGYTKDPDFQLRVRRNGRQWGKWQTGKLGKSGDTDPWWYWGSQGNGLVWQFEYRCGEDAPLNIAAMQALYTRIN